MNKIILMIAVVGMMTGCISGKPKSDTYTDQSGKTTLIESDREQCERICNDDYSRCMESDDARSNGGVHGPAGMFGASSDCRDSLSSCMSSCKARPPSDQPVP